MAEECYEPKYLQASFKGIPFEAMEVSSEHGRRGAEGEFPFGEDTAYADLGRRIRTYGLRGRLAQNSHIMLSAALIAACESPGPGVLIHPTRGVLNVACKSIRVSDDLFEEQGVTRIDLEFVEANLWRNGLSLVGSILGLILTPLLTASSDQFERDYNIQAERFYRRDETKETARQAVAQVQTKYQDAISPTSDLNKLRANADLRDIATDNQLVATTRTVDDALSLGMSALAQEIGGMEKFQAFRDIANWAASQGSQSTVSGNAVISHTRILAAAYMAQAAVQEQFPSTGDALDALDRVAAILEQEAQIANQDCDNRLFLALRNFSAEFQAIMYERAYNFPKLIGYDFDGAVSPLVAAYAIWGDAKRHRELEKANIVGRYGRVGSSVQAATVR